MAELMGLLKSALDIPNARLVLLCGATVALLGVLLSAAGVGHWLGPGRRAWAHGLPIAAVALLAAGLGKFELAIAILFGTSVAMLSAVMGFLALAGSPGTLPNRYRSMWLLLPVAGLLAFVSGFRGEFTWLQAGVLAAEGMLLLWVWDEPIHFAAQAIDQSAEPATATPGVSGWPVVLSLLGAAAAAVGAYVALHGAQRLALESDAYPLTITSGILLSVTLALPLIRSGTRLAERGQAWSPMTSAIAVVLMNLCGTLPAAIVVGKLRHAKFNSAPWPIFESFSTTYFLPSIWRVDAVFIVLLAILLAPVGAGRLKLDRVFGGMLIVAYAVYLLATLWAAVKG